MLDSCSNDKEKQVMWIEKEVQVIGAMPDQNCFDKILLHLMPAWCAGPSQNICVRSVSVLSSLPGLLSQPYLCYPHSPGCSIPQENAAQCWTRDSLQFCKVTTALTHSSRQGKSLRIFSGTKPTSKPTGNIFHSI